MSNFIYHATTSTKLEEILSTGLKPETVRGSVWKYMPSKVDLIPTSRAYPVEQFYKQEELRAGGNGIDRKPVLIGKPLLICQIDLDGILSNNLTPSPEYIAEVLWKDKDNIKDPYLREATSREHLAKGINPEVFAHLWEQSLREYGSVYIAGGVMPGAITSYVLIDSDAFQIISELANVEPSTKDYLSLGTYRQCLIEFVFGGPAPLRPVEYLSDIEIKQYESIFSTQQGETIDICSLCDQWRATLYEERATHISLYRKTTSTSREYQRVPSEDQDTTTVHRSPEIVQNPA